MTRPPDPLAELDRANDWVGWVIIIVLVCLIVGAWFGLRWLRPEAPPSAARAPLSTCRAPAAGEVVNLTVMASESGALAVHCSPPYLTQRGPR